MDIAQPSHNTPRLWLYCWDNTEWLETTYAVIDITPEWAKRVLARVHLMAGLRALENRAQLYQMEYWDYTPDWVHRISDASLEADDTVAEEFFDAVENTETLYCRVDECPFPVIADDYYQRVECVTMRVQEDGVSWACHVKHGEGARLWTQEIPLRDLECYARGEIPPNIPVYTPEPRDEQPSA